MMRCISIVVIVVVAAAQGAINLGSSIFKESNRPTQAGPVMCQQGGKYHYAECCYNTIHDTQFCFGVPPIMKRDDCWPPGFPDLEASCCQPAPWGQDMCWANGYSYLECCDHGLYAPFQINNTFVTEFQSISAHETRRNHLHAIRLSQTKFFESMFNVSGDAYVKHRWTGCEIEYADCTPLQSHVEISNMVKIMNNLRPGVYLEWGTGCSAAWMSAFAMNTFVIDMDPTWIDKVMNLGLPRCLREHGRFFGNSPSLTRDDGSWIPITTFGHPQDPNDAWVLGSQYVNFIEAFDVTNNTIEIVLIDGRYRIACALKLLNYNVRYIFFHDWTSRPHYHAPVLQFYEWHNPRDYATFEVTQDSVAILTPKPIHERPAGWETAFELYLHDSH
jgi:hypothetical protein